MLMNFENLTFFKQNFSAKTKYTKVVTYKDKKNVSTENNFKYLSNHFKGLCNDSLLGRIKSNDRLNL